MKGLDISRVIVTGGAGFIGSHVADALLADGSDVVILVDNMHLGKKQNIEQSLTKGAKLVVADARDEEALTSLVKEFEITTIFNMAVISLPECLENPKISSLINLELTLAACEVARKTGIGILHFSSSEVFGTAQYSPMDENHSMGAHTTYAADKTASDLQVRAYGKTYGIKYIIVRPFNTYGPRQNWYKFAGVIPKVIRMIIKGKTPTIFGPGDQTRGYTYVCDTARLAVQLAKKGEIGEDYNLGPETEERIGDLITTIRDYMVGKHNYSFVEIIHEKERLGDVSRLIPSDAKAENVLGSIKYKLFTEGLRETVDWYLEEYKSGQLPLENAF